MEQVAVDVRLLLKCRPVEADNSRLSPVAAHTGVIANLATRRRRTPAYLAVHRTTITNDEREGYSNFYAAV